jgi:hypothetical protein
MKKKEATDLTTWIHLWNAGGQVSVVADPARMNMSYAHGAFPSLAQAAGRTLYAQTFSLAATLLGN